MMVVGGYKVVVVPTMSSVEAVMWWWFVVVVTAVLVGYGVMLDDVQLHAMFHFQRWLMFSSQPCWICGDGWWFCGGFGVGGEVIGAVGVGMICCLVVVVGCWSWVIGVCCSATVQVVVCCCGDSFGGGSLWGSWGCFGLEGGGGLFWIRIWCWNNLRIGGIKGSGWC